MKEIVVSYFLFCVVMLQTSVLLYSYLQQQVSTDSAWKKSRYK